MELAYNPSGYVIRGPVPSDLPSVSVQPSVTVVVAGQAGIIDHKDGTFNGQTSPEAKTTSVVSVSPSDMFPGAVSLSIDPADAAVCSIAGDGTINRTSNGICRLIASGAGLSRHLSINYEYATVSAYFDSVTSYKTGSLRKYLHEQQEAMFSGNTPGIGQRFFVNGDGTGGVNPDLLTGRAVPNFTPFDATRIRNSQHWLTDHVYFIRNGISHGYSATAAERGIDSDTTLRFGARPVGTPIMKLLPQNWKDYVGDVSGIAVLPLIGALTHSYDFSSGSEDKYWLCPVDVTKTWTAIGNGALTGPDLRAPGGQHYSNVQPKAIYPSNSARVAFSRPTQYWDSDFGDTMQNVICTGGDSHSPLFVGINGELIYIGTVFGYGGAIDFFPDRFDLIQSAVNSLCDQNAIARETLTAVDLSMFNVYP